jgi:hypothetical protein
VATTPLLATPLTSPVTLALAPGSVLPGLSLNLSGPVQLPLMGSIGLAGGLIQNSFAGIPDVPLERFDLAFDTHSPLLLARNVCTGPRQSVRGQFTGHNGAVAKVTAPLKVAGCPPVVTFKRRGHRLTVRITAGRDGAAIKSATLTAPGAKRRSVKTKQTITLRRLPGKKAFRVVVKDTAKQSWTLKVKA